MSTQAELQRLLAEINLSEGEARGWLERFRAEYEFAGRLLAAHPEREGEWAPLLAEAARGLLAALQAGASVSQAVAQAEATMGPVGLAAKQYVIYCCGHAHIDMNWMWTWPETVAVTYDTFSTMDQLMDEFPEFHFSQSQASVYHLTQKYAPEQFARIRRRVAEGRWEVTASQWVEGEQFSLLPGDYFRQPK